MTDPNKDEHIEELLGKLQGIFGKLSHSEEEDAKQKIEIPAAAPKEKPPKETTPVQQPPAPKPAPPAPINMYEEPVAAKPPSPVPKPVPAPSPTPPPANPPVVPMTPPAPATAPSTAMSGNGDYQSSVPAEDPERMIVPTAIYFPQGREGDAKTLAQKLETMTPRFTKVAFRLRVCVFLPYDPKTEWKDAILAKSTQVEFKTVFVAMDRPLEDARRKGVAAELEGRNIYFQEITMNSIEKKAIYTDILLGLVFFFDSRKPAADAEGS